MSVRKFIWRRVVRPLGMFALYHTGQFDLTERRLRRLRRCGLEVRWAVDGGAAQGDWADRLKRIYPGCQLLCVEPRAHTQASLHALARARGGIQVARALLGEAEGTAVFSESGEQSSVFPNSRGERFGAVSEVPVTTLDRLYEGTSFAGPDLIKLDLQGAELACLRGATRCLAQAQVVILETNLLELYRGAPLAVDVVQFMRERGFRLHDILSLFHRPSDGALAFGDFLFLRDGHALLLDESWSPNAAWERGHARPLPG